jgi:UDP-glucose 6-dehydrogenase
MTTQNQEGINLHPLIKLVVPEATFYSIVDKVKNEKTPSRKLADEFNYSLVAINSIRSKAISMGLLERPVGVLKMMETLKKRRESGIKFTKKSAKSTKLTKEVNRTIKITTPLEKEPLSNSKFVNIKFGEIEVVVEKSANIVITKDKIVIN